MLRVGIVGTGWVAGEHMLAYQENPATQVVAVTSRTKAGAEAKLAEVGLEDCKIRTDYREMLDKDRPDIVSICTPNHLHTEETISAAEAGCHILIEKPVALHMEDMIKMRDAVRKTGVKTVVSFVLRWNPLFQIIKAQLADDAIGRIFYGEVDYYHGIGPWYKQYAWNVKKDIGGSSFLSAGCHAVDGLRWFLDQEVVEVCSYSTKSNAPNFQYEYDPTSVMILKFADGAIGKAASSIECVMPYVFHISLLGDKGTIRNNQIYSHKMPGQTHFATVPTILPDSGDVTHHPFQAEIDHIVTCIQNDEESHVNLEDAVKTHEIIFAADRSAAEGRPVQLPLIS